jgi:RNA polymerase sigma-32 factor
MLELENENLEVAINSLDSRSQYIIKARWLSEEPQTFEELAEKFDVSLQRISQIEKQALQKIKEKLVG